MRPNLSLPQVSGISNDFLFRNRMPVQPYYNTPYGTNNNTGMTFSPATVQPIVPTLPSAPPIVPTLPSAPLQPKLNHEDLNRMYDIIKGKINELIETRVEKDKQLPENFKKTIKDVIREVIRNELPGMVNTDADPLHIRAQCEEINRKVMEEYNILRREIKEYSIKQDIMNDKIDATTRMLNDAEIITSKLEEKLDTKLKNVNKRITENVDKNKKRYKQTMNEMNDIRKRRDEMKGKIKTDINNLYKIFSDTNIMNEELKEMIDTLARKVRDDKGEINNTVDTIRQRVDIMEKNNTITNENATRIFSAIEQLRQDKDSMNTMIISLSKMNEMTNEEQLIQNRKIGDLQTNQELLFQKINNMEELNKTFTQEYNMNKINQGLHIDQIVENIKGKNDEIEAKLKEFRKNLRTKGSKEYEMKQQLEINTSEIMKIKEENKKDTENFNNLSEQVVELLKNATIDKNRILVIKNLLKEFRKDQNSLDKIVTGYESRVTALETEVPKIREEIRKVGIELFQMKGDNSKMISEIFNRLSTVEGVQRQLQDTYNDGRIIILNNIRELQNNLAKTNSTLIGAFTDFTKRLNQEDMNINEINTKYDELKKLVEKEINDKNLDKANLKIKLDNIDGGLDAALFLHKTAMKRIKEIENNPLTTAVMGTASNIRNVGASIKSAIGLGTPTAIKYMKYKIKYLNLQSKF